MTPNPIDWRRQNDMVPVLRTPTGKPAEMACAARDTAGLSPTEIRKIVLDILG